MKTKTGAAIAALLLASACNKGADGNASANAAAPVPVAVPAAPAAAPGPDLAGARRLIDTVYTPYTRDQTEDYFRYFTPELNAAIDRAGEGAVEADPLCECQDMTRFTYRVQSLEPETGGALARVAISNNGEPKTIILHLVQRGATWLIADVGEGATSFAAGLRR
jgi:hypothetical protein